MSIYIFLGPTMPVHEAADYLDVTYLPPVACGDVQRLIDAKPRAIGIIDGVFQYKPSVFHKEILCALSEGIRVFGASSMGALRAAELHAFGMEGVGQIFEDYRSGKQEDDDEVAVVHGEGETNYVPYSVAMVNLREGLRRAAAAGCIGDDVRGKLERLAKEMFYPHRSWESLYAAAKQSGIAVDGLRAFVAREKPDQKRDDAVLLLQHMASELASDTKPRRPSFKFSRTMWWRRLRANVEHAGNYGAACSGNVPADAFTLHAKLFADSERTLTREAMYLSLVAEVAELRGLVASEKEVEKTRQTLGLCGSDRATTTRATLESLANKLARVGSTAQMSSFVPVALSRRDQLASIVEEVKEKWDCLRSRGLTRPTLAMSDVDPEALIEWFQGKTGAAETSIEELARALQVNVEEFTAEALRQYLFEQQSY